MAARRMSCRFRIEQKFKGRRNLVLRLLGVMLVVGFVPLSRAAQSVTLAWNANSETNLAGYRLYYGTGTRAYATNVTVDNLSTTATVSNLLENVTYYFAVTAFCSD